MHKVLKDSHPTQIKVEKVMKLLTELDLDIASSFDGGFIITDRGYSVDGPLEVKVHEIEGEVLQDLPGIFEYKLIVIE